ncbi:SSU ribosomal protein S20p [hydrothermal vent metagenome]|uniref:SSU ribosomal protein S20p n=1 Tax=hydrothermal vent metagenome TaxID=652676 RepID=A0A3B0SMR4_9ZZZZ
MANTSSAKKAIRQIARRTAVNKSRRTQVRSTLRLVEEAIASGDQAAAKKALAVAEPAMMKAVGKGIFHKNTGARKISRLSHRIKSLAAK